MIKLSPPYKKQILYFNRAESDSASGLESDSDFPSGSALASALSSAPDSVVARDSDSVPGSAPAQDSGSATVTALAFVPAPALSSTPLELWEPLLSFQLLMVSADFCARLHAQA